QLRVWHRLRRRGRLWGLLRQQQRVLQSADCPAGARRGDDVPRRQSGNGGQLDDGDPAENDGEKSDRVLAPMSRGGAPTSGLGPPNVRRLEGSRDVALSFSVPVSRRCSNFASGPLERPGRSKRAGTWHLSSGIGIYRLDAAEAEVIAAGRHFTLAARSDHVA